MIGRSFRMVVLALIPAVAVIGACAEDIETGANCPALCPGQEIEIKDTLIDAAYVFDTSLVGFPLQGIDAALLLASRGDTLNVKAVVRFDTLTVRYLSPTEDSLLPAVYVDSAFLTFTMRKGRIPLPFRSNINVYDVTDTLLPDTARAALLPYFTASRLLGSISIDSATFSDSVRFKIPLDTAKLWPIISDTLRPPLRLGLEVESSGSVEFLITPENLGVSGGPLLQYKISPDTAVDPVVGLQPSSLSPATPRFVAEDYIDYSIIADAPVLTETGKFLTGGMPGSRAYLRFNMPLWLTDSVGILRVRLQLTQDPLYGMYQDDTVQLLTHLVLAGNTVTELERAATLLTSANLFAPNLKLVPGDSGTVFLDMNQLVLQWRTFDGTRPLPSAIVFRTDAEGQSAQALRFFGMSYPDAALRPKLRVSYTRSIAFGQP